jgi:biotin transport system substrate-specific component
MNNKTLVLTDLLLLQLQGLKRVCLNAVLVVAGVVYVALLSQVAFPLPWTPVMVSLGTFAVLTAGATLGGKRAVISLSLYAVLGFAGVPVFQGAKSGFGLVTMGYVVGYIFAAWLAGKFAQRAKDRKPLGVVAMFVVGNLVIYIFGVAWMAYFLSISPIAALQMGVLPFLVGDALKIALAAGLLPSIWKLVDKKR